MKMRKFCTHGQIYFWPVCTNFYSPFALPQSLCARKKRKWGNWHMDSMKDDPYVSDFLHSGKTKECWKTKIYSPIQNSESVVTTGVHEVWWRFLSLRALWKNSLSDYFSFLEILEFQNCFGLQKTWKYAELCSHRKPWKRLDTTHTDKNEKQISDHTQRSWKYLSFVTHGEIWKLKLFDITVCTGKTKFAGKSDFHHK